MKIDNQLVLISDVIEKKKKSCLTLNRKTLWILILTVNGYYKNYRKAVHCMFVKDGLEKLKGIKAFSVNTDDSLGACPLSHKGSYSETPNNWRADHLIHYLARPG